MIFDALVLVVVLGGVLVVGSFVAGILDMMSASRRQTALAKKVRRGDEWY